MNTYLDIRDSKYGYPYKQRCCYVFMDGENRNFPDESTQVYKKKQISLLVI